MTKEELKWFNDHNQNSLPKDYCKWAKPFIDRQGNCGYACMNEEVLNNWGLPIASTCCEPWLKCTKKQPGVFGIDKDKIDISSIIYPHKSQNEYKNLQNKNDTINWKYLWLTISIIFLIIILKYV